jgi:hypothetical protein
VHVHPAPRREPRARAVIAERGVVRYDHPVTRPGIARWIRALQVILAALLGVPVFGMCVPFTLLEFHLVPSLGLGNVVYVAAGAAMGLLAGGIGGAYTLRGDALFPRRYVALVLTFLAAMAAALLAARYGGAFAHV